MIPSQIARKWNHVGANETMSFSTASVKSCHCAYALTNDSVAPTAVLRGTIANDLAAAHPVPSRALHDCRDYRSARRTEDDH
jgi:hypothetical protein